MNRIAYVVHADYGCESGCCGHRASLETPDGQEVDSRFEFSHPWDCKTKEDFDKWAVDFCKTIWPECEVDLSRCILDGEN